MFAATGNAIPHQNIEVALHVIDIVKRFGETLANDHISLELRQGEVLALLGENGAGKSTLVKILSGIYEPDEGKVFVADRYVTIKSPLDAMAHGIGVVHQQFMLIPTLTVLENIMLGSSPTTKWGLLDAKAARQRLIDLAGKFDFDVDPEARIDALSIGTQQRVEILKAMYHGAQILILDEPTAVLTPSETDKLLLLVRSLAAEGSSVIFISHKLNEVKSVADRVAVLRAGKVVGVVAATDATASELAMMMIGRSHTFQRNSPPRSGNDVVLTIERLSCEGDTKASGLKEINMQVRRGEIVGIAGVDGNGQRELAECVAALRRYSGRISIGGMEPSVAFQDPAILGFMPEDRKEQGLIDRFSVTENLLLRSIALPPFSRSGFISWGVARRHAQEQIAIHHIQCPGPDALVRYLSGGNQQKVIVARETYPEPALLVAAQATRGLDVGAVQDVLDGLREQRDHGGGVLLISTELPELLVVCDRILVMHRGRIMGEVPPFEESIEAIGSMMMGSTVAEGSAS